MNGFAHFQKQIYLWGTITALLLLASANSAIGTDLDGKIVFSTQELLNIIDLENRDTWKAPLTIPLTHRLDMAHYVTWMPRGDSVMFEYTPWAEEDIYLTKRHLALIDIRTRRVTPWRESAVPNTRNIFYPKWSPDGRCMAFLKYVKHDLIPNGKGRIVGVKRFYELFVYGKHDKELREIARGYADRQPFSWSSDSKKIAYVASDRRLVVYDIERNDAMIIGKGFQPTFDPRSNALYFIGEDKHLNKLVLKDMRPRRVDESDWSWSRLIGISKNGKNLFFIGGGSIGLWEYSTIDVFDLEAGEKRTISKRYGIMHGAALFED
jgi:Tol biopolymer transport system component